MQTIKQEQIAKAEYILSLYDSKLSLEPIGNAQVQVKTNYNDNGYSYNIYNKNTTKGK
jgi:hypothetical protein